MVGCDPASQAPPKPSRIIPAWLPGIGKIREKSFPQDPVGQPGRLVHYAVPGFQTIRGICFRAEPLRGRIGYRASACVAILERGSQPAFCRIAQSAGQVVRDAASGHLCFVFGGSRSGYESVPVVTVPLGVDAAKLDREIGGTAVVRPRRSHRVCRRLDRRSG